MIEEHQLHPALGEHLGHFVRFAPPQEEPRIGLGAMTDQARKLKVPCRQRQRSQFVE
jgi:hypothetical protein